MQKKTATDPAARAAAAVRAIGFMLVSVLAAKVLVNGLVDFHLLERKWHDNSSSDPSSFFPALLSIPCWMAASAIRRRQRMGMVLGDLCAFLTTIALLFLLVGWNYVMFSGWQWRDMSPWKIGSVETCLLCFLGASIGTNVELDRASRPPNP